MSISEPADIRLSIGTYGLKEIVVNNQDLTEFCKSVQITADSGAVPVVSLLLAPTPFEVEGPGVVMAQQEGGGSMREVVLEFLNRMDGGYLERKSLESMDFGSSTGDCFLRLMKEMASELP